MLYVTALLAGGMGSLAFLAFRCHGLCKKCHILNRENETLRKENTKLANWVSESME